MVIDLRSDTFTKPTPEMRDTMARAEVGDDVFGEDPTVNRLQDHIADLFGKEAALFTASGTMGNQIAINALTQPGQEVILDSNAHIFYYEAGAPAILSGVQLRTLDSNNGILTKEKIESAIRPENVHFPPTSLICLENTHNRAGGTIFPIEEIKRIRQLAEERGIRMHLDGARLWNASVATGVPLREYGQYFDSITVCFSKGLGAPVGSCVVGDADFIKRAHRYRKIYGGGMRQAGIIAAGALYAVQNHIDKLKDDHAHAKLLAESVASLPGFEVNLPSVQTNIIMIHIQADSEITAAQVAEQLKSENVLLLALDPKRLRAVTHLDVSKDDIVQAVDIFKKIRIK